MRVEKFAPSYRKHPHGASFGGVFKQYCNLIISYPLYSWPVPKWESPAKALQFQRCRDGESLFLGVWRASLAGVLGNAWARLALGAWRVAWPIWKPISRADIFSSNSFSSFPALVPSWADGFAVVARLFFLPKFSCIFFKVHSDLA